MIKVNCGKALLGVFAGITASAVMVTATATSYAADQAQALSEKLATTPASFELTGNKGEVLTNQIRLDNPNPYAVTINTSAENFVAQGEEGSVSLTPDSTPFSLASWITVSPQKTVIVANGSELFTFQIAIPTDAEPGGHFGSVLFSTVPQKPNGSGAALSQSIGALLLLKIPGATNISWHIESFQPERTFFLSPPLNFLFRVKDTGNVHIRPTGAVTLTSMFGQKIVRAVPESNVLPDAIRKSIVSIPMNFTFGRYTAELSLNVEGGLKTATITVWAFPGKLILIFGAVLIVILFVGITARKRLKKAFLALTGK